MGQFISRAVATSDKLKPPGQRTDLAQDYARSGKSATETADLIGVSTRTIEMVRAIHASDDEETKVALDDGEITVNAAYRAVKQAS
jgi:hypothetical protein